MLDPRRLRSCLQLNSIREFFETKELAFHHEIETAGTGCGHVIVGLYLLPRRVPASAEQRVRTLDVVVSRR